MRTLTRTENAWAHAVVGTLFPVHSRLGPGPSARDVETFLVEVRSQAPYRAALGLRVALWVVTLAPLFVLRRARTFGHLGPAEREAVLVAIAASSFYVLRQVIVMLKAIFAMLYVDRAAVRDAIAPPIDAGVADTGPRLIAIGTKRRVSPIDNPGLDCREGVEEAAQEESSHGRNVA